MPRAGHEPNSRSHQPATVRNVRPMTEWIALGTAIISALGLLFAGQQVRQGNRQAREDRRLGLDGVVVYWRPTSAPAAASADGTAIWKYAITIANPGKFAIDHVSVQWTFDCDVQRVRSNGSLDPSTRQLALTLPVLPGGGDHTWDRTLRINFADATATLPATSAHVQFRDLTGVERENRWPRPTARRGRAAK